MKQYTSNIQTAKLIELGFEKPKGWCVESISSRLQLYKHKDDDEGFNYSIGELYEITSNRTIPMQVHYEKGVFDLPHMTLKVYIDGMWCTMLDKRNVELIDFLFEAIVKLKEERVI